MSRFPLRVLLLSLSSSIAASLIPCAEAAADGSTAATNPPLTRWRGAAGMTTSV